VYAFGVNDGGTICGEAGWPTEAVVWQLLPQLL
jgi:hypothetical protein